MFTAFCINVVLNKAVLRGGFCRVYVSLISCLQDSHEDRGGLVGLGVVAEEVGAVRDSGAVWCCARGSVDCAGA